MFDVDEARRIVLERYPDARLEPVAFWFRIWANGRCLNGDFMDAPNRAWEDAARRVERAESRPT